MHSLEWRFARTRHYASEKGPVDQAFQRAVAQYLGRPTEPVPSASQAGVALP